MKLFVKMEQRDKHLSVEMCVRYTSNSFQL